MSECERKMGFEIQAGRRDGDMRIPLGLTAALNLEARKIEVWRDRGILGKTWQPRPKSQNVFPC